ncbi:MAG TPA: hypothetical protein VIL31_05020 [Cyclobacteriaceae bacterium]|jgi:hypothetical protein
MMVGYILALVLIGGLIGLHYRLNRSVLTSWYWPALAVKILAGLAVGYMYAIYHDAGDPINFSRDASYLTSIAGEDPSRYIEFLWSGHMLEGFVNDQPRSVFMVKVLSLIYLITWDNFWIASVYISFFSFIGAWFLVRVVTTRWHVQIPAVIAFLFWPSIVFWTSGILKEAIAIPCLYIMVGCVLIIRDRPRSVYAWLGLILASWLGWKLKYYNVGVFLASGLTALLVQYMISVLQIVNRYGQALLWLVVFGVLTGGVTFLHPNFDLQWLPEVVAYNYRLSLEMSGGLGAMEFPGLEASWTSIASHAPNALFSGLFRPFLWEANSLLAIAGAIENLVLLVLFLWAIFHFLRNPRCNEPLLFMAAAVAILILGVVLPLSTPNFGTLSRYRVGYLSLFVFFTLRGIPLPRIR